MISRILLWKGILEGVGIELDGSKETSSLPKLPMRREKHQEIWYLLTGTKINRAHEWRVFEKGKKSIYTNTASQSQSPFALKHYKLIKWNQEAFDMIICFHNFFWFTPLKMLWMLRHLIGVGIDSLKGSFRKLDCLMILLLANSLW